jgi:glucan phosphoethanolaminetransferase (alkaline phosphatase superfamily)
MKSKEVITAGITGTTFMTLFSYLISVADGENFSEPERLGQLAERLLPKLSKEQGQALGWLGHYAVGLLFALVYVELWRRRRPKSSIKNNLLVGAVSGLIAVAIWKTTFKLHPLPPALSFNKYYLQLVPAHVVFAVFAGIGYQILKRRKFLSYEEEEKRNKEMVGRGDRT